MNNLDNNETKKNLYMISYIFMIVATGIGALAIIPLLWFIPMTKATKKAWQQVGTDEEQQHIVLAVCNMIFVWIFGGLFMLLGDLFFPKANNKSDQIEI